MMIQCLRTTALTLAVLAMGANASALDLFNDTFDGTDIQDAIGQSGPAAPLTYSTNLLPAAGGTAPSIVEGAGILTMDAGGFSGATEFSPDHNFNSAGIVAAGGFTVTLDDALPNTAGASGAGSWIGATLFEAPGGDGNVLASAYSFLLRDNGEAVIISDFGGPDQQFLFTGPQAGLAGGAHDIVLEVSIDAFSAAGTATIQAFVDGIHQAAVDTTLTGLDLSDNHIWVREVDAISTLGGFSVSIPEPTSLLLASLAGLALAVRRRK